MRVKKLVGVFTALAIALLTAVISIPSAAASSADAQFANRLHVLINDYRAQHALAPLALDARMTADSQWWTQQSADQANIHGAGVFQHSPGSYAFHENIVWNMSAEQAFSWWVNSPAHRANMLRAADTHIGIGAVQLTAGPNKGVFLATAQFGRSAVTPQDEAAAREAAERAAAEAAAAKAAEEAAAKAAEEAAAKAAADAAAAESAAKAAAEKAAADAAAKAAADKAAADAAAKAAAEKAAEEAAAQTPAPGAPVPAPDNTEPAKDTAAEDKAAEEAAAAKAAEEAAAAKAAEEKAAETAAAKAAEEAAARKTAEEAAAAAAAEAAQQAADELAAAREAEIAAEQNAAASEAAQAAEADAAEQAAAEEAAAAQAAAENAAAEAAAVQAAEKKARAAAAAAMDQVALGNDAILTDSARGTATATASGSQLRISGLEAAASYEVVLPSAGVNLGMTAADATGSLAVAVPAVLAAGEHKVALFRNGVLSGWTTFTVEQAVTVLSAQPAPAAADGTTELAATGLNAAQLSIGGIGALMALTGGAALVALQRQRSASAR
ncbi:CAP domain-containing protein [Arthrobacter sp. ATA002]|uniref:CAP domain-containing protein n=1 Tax=Arthrobacter sp. ATA002 TaxID=2991715 RepID=UPI0022A78D1E|nr:CAP domain-containing protein [Arthrobacter sp. ATA002]WAP52476.1 CAP domain-containing protein [Arthrobacter sp. ATA002]